MQHVGAARLHDVRGVEHLHDLEAGDAFSSCRGDGSTCYMREAARRGSQQEHRVACSAVLAACTCEMALDAFTAMNSDEDWLNADVFAVIAVLCAAVRHFNLVS